MSNLHDKKVNLGAACFRCRGFRHACDRKTPTCTRCYRRGISCVYPEAAPTLKRLQQTAEEINEKIKHLHTKLRMNAKTRIPVPVSITQYSIHPCTKCFKDLQQCDLKKSRCSRCIANHFDCEYTKTEPKANNVSQILNTMNKVLYQWRDAIDKTREAPASLKITRLKSGILMESNVQSIHGFSELIDQLTRAMTPRASYQKKKKSDTIDFDTANSLLACWKPTLAKPPVPAATHITQPLTDYLVHLYCRPKNTHIPILDTAEFLDRYLDVDSRPSLVLIYAMCAAAARHAFQPSTESKALSAAYCSRARELLSYDTPSLESCQAAFLLSCCHYQDGDNSGIYEWIAYTMALELGMYQEATRYESMLVWGIYYFHSWYKGTRGIHTPSTCLCLLSKQQQTSEDEYYVWNSWVYLIQLQRIRDRAKETNTPQTLMVLQKTLLEFHDHLIPDWQLVHGVLPQQLESPLSFTSTCCSPQTSYFSEEERSTDNDVKLHCIRLVGIHFYITQVLLYEPFVLMHRVPSTPFAIQSVNIILTAVNQISDLCELMAQKHQEDQLSVSALLMIHTVYQKVLTCQHDQYSFIAKLGLLRLSDISKYYKGLDLLIQTPQK